MDFVIDLLLFIDWKNNSYDLILVIVKRLIKMVHYKPVKVIIHALGLAEVIIDMAMQNHSFLDSIISDCRPVFTSKF